MPTKIMDQRQLSPYHMSSLPTSFFSDDLCFASEVGFWKADSRADNRGMDARSKPVSSSPLKKVGPMGGNTVECLDLPQAYVLKDQKTKTGLEHHLRGTTSTSGLSRNLWRAPNQDHGSRLSSYTQPASQSSERNTVNFNGGYYDNGLFINSMSEIFNKKLSLSNEVPFGRSVDTSDFGDNEPFESSKETEAQTIGNLLPDDEDLLSGINYDYDDTACRNNGAEFEDDLFCSGGGMELETGNTLNFNRSSDSVGGKSSYAQMVGTTAPFPDEHDGGELPFRTPFSRNINSNIEDAELRDIYEDIPSGKDINQGTLVVFNLNSSVSNEDLRQIFGVYGEVKEIRENPHKHHYRFVEFYDVRAAEAAFRALNKRDIAGNRIKLVPSRPGGARRCLMQQLSRELDQEETTGCERAGPSCISPPECFGSPGTKFRVNTSNVLDNMPFHDLHSSAQPLATSFMDSTCHGTPNVHSSFSPMRATTINSPSNQSSMGDLGHSMRALNASYQCRPAYHPHSLPEYHGGMVHEIPFSLPRPMDNSRSAAGLTNSHLCKVCAGGLNNHSFEHNENAFGSLGNGSGSRGNPYLVNGSDTHRRPHGAMMWQNSPTFGNTIPSHPSMHGYPRTPSNLSNTLLSLYNHPVGSAPTVNPSIWDRQHAYMGDNMETAFHPVSLGGMGFPGSSPVRALELAPRSMLPRTSGNCLDHSTASAHVGNPRQQRRHNFHGKNMSIWNRRNDSGTNQVDNKKQYELDIDRILRGDDSRTTLMLKNIPNKYTSKMLLTTIDENHRGTYDFIYLPIDFKNKCNMGYAFINMVDPQQIVPFYKAFDGKKWEKFNSEKVASLAYARIQGRQALVAHFQNSSLMNEDKRCRPILFHTDGPNAGDQEPFPMGTNIRSRPGRSRSANTEESQHGSPPSSADDEESFNTAGSASISTESQ